MTLDLSFAFTIFFLTLGPIKTVPAFAMITADLDGAARRWLAIRATLMASLIVFATALVFYGTMKGWRISAPAIEIAGGLLLFISASHAVSAGLGGGGVALAPPAPKPLDDEAKRRVLSPLAVPTIVTPIGLVAILVFTDAAQGNWTQLLGVYGLLAVIMALNLVGMLAARAILGVVGLTLFRVLGWIFAILQAGLAVQAVVWGLRSLGVMPA